MRIALTGASGLIGSNIARQASQAGHHVTALVRETSRREHIEPFVDRFVVGTQDDQSVWPDLLDGADCVVHNSVDWSPLRSKNLDEHLRSNLDGSIKLLQASAPRQFIFMSSVAVHHDIKPEWHGVIDENHPTRPAGLYGAYKTAVEPHLWWAHFSDNRNTCAIRPSAVYGIDPKLERSIGYKIIEQIQRGEPFTKQGGGKFVHVEDVAAVVVKALGNDAVAGQTFSMADCYARWGDWAKTTAAIMNIDVEIDLSSPAESKNRFSKDAVQSLGIAMNRGHDGIRGHLRELITAMQQTTV